MSYKLLLIDDSRLMREKAGESLRQTPLDIAEIHFAANAEEGLACLTEHAVDVVLCDRHMPGTDGLEFAQMAKAIGTTPVILLGHHSTGPEPVEAVAAGAQGYMTKPFTQEAAVREIESVLRMVS